MRLIVFVACVFLGAHLMQLGGLYMFFGFMVSFYGGFQLVDNRA